MLHVDIVNAFVTDHAFSGNPAAVILLESWLDDQRLQQIAEQHNLSETAYLVRKEDHWHIRWFTPAVEVRLCGHATLASAYMIQEKTGERHIEMDSLSGKLSVDIKSDDIQLNFPADPPSRSSLDEHFIEALGTPPIEIWTGRDDYLLIYETEETVADLSPDFSALRSADGRGFLATAPGRESDFVYRGFFPQAGIDEDPATGSAQTPLVPYWSDRLGKDRLSSRQLSTRGAEFTSTFLGDRVLISGRCQKYLEGTIYL